MGKPRPVRTFEMPHTTRSRVRADDVMITRRTRYESAVIPYAAILAAVAVVEDDDDEPPWERHDGDEHHLVPVDTLAGDYDPDAYLPNRDSIVVVDGADDWGVAAFAHARGASKQVAFERAAAEKRRTRDRIVDWYRHSWTWYGVRGEFKGIDASVWGIDDPGDAERYVVPEIADEIADRLEIEGWTVTDRPDPDQAPRADRRRGFYFHLANNLGFESPDDYLDWRRAGPPRLP